MFQRVIVILGIVGLLLPGCTGKMSQQAISPEAGNLVSGKLLYASCAPCHGSEAGGNKSMRAPKLAGLESWYLVRQLDHFKKGIRGNHPADTLGQQMAAMITPLKDSVAIKDVVAYIASLPNIHSEDLQAGDASSGERLYHSICGSCHGPGGKGNKLLNTPTLTGLDATYLKRQLLHFQKGIRGSHPDDLYGAQMVSMAGMLKNEKAIDDVIAYINQKRVQ